ncbi:MAG: RtcB family protein [Elusimicrobia bacterium]|nr:RtcB family protein [Elusimicrobiota bacterium]
MRFKKLDDFRWELPRSGSMRVSGLVYASESMLAKLESEKVADQVGNVASLPGIASSSMAMPDAHWGYGFPIGGVAAMRVEDGVISPGGVGYDISCGVRLLRTELEAAKLKPRVSGLMDALFAAVPSGVGSEGRLRVKPGELRRVLEKGAAWPVEHGMGSREDLEACEDNGTLESADAGEVSERALERGAAQLGTLGSGNHFLELQEVDEVYDEEAARVFGLFKGQLVVLIHTGSRGLGYQVCDDYLRVMQDAARKYRIELPDRQLACAPFSSDEGQRYFRAMNAAGNYAKANRQVITHWVREAFMRHLQTGPAELGMAVVYDVSHNLAKVESHKLEGALAKLLVHRKGATRAFPAGRPEVPVRYRGVGQPVLVPGSMGTFSYVLAGTETAMEETFGSTCHGAGRTMSRTQALKTTRGEDLRRDLRRQGIEVRTDSMKGLAEEAPSAYKDVCAVVEVCQGAGISRKVARMRPLGVVKG